MLNEEIISESRYLDATTEVMETSGQSYVTDSTFDNYQAGIFQTQIEDVITTSGDSRICVMIYNASPLCWGGQIDYQVPGNQYTPQEFGYYSLDIEDISLGRSGSEICVLDNGEVYCWGYLIHFGLNYVTSPYKVQFQNNKIPIAIESGGSGDYHMNFAMMEDGTIQCWGKFSSGNYHLRQTCHTFDSNNPINYWDLQQYDNSYSTLFSGTPSGISNYQFGNQLEIDGGKGGCHLTLDDHLLCWGENLKTSSGGTNQQHIDEQVENFSVGSEHACYSTNQNNIPYLICFGKQNYGALGNGQSHNSWSSNWLGSSDFGGLDFVSFTAGHYNNCVILSDGSLQCWGEGSSLCGLYGTTQMSPTSIPLGGNHQGEKVYLTGSSTYVLTTEGKLISCGNQYAGQGNGQTTSFAEVNLVSQQRLMFENNAEGKFMILDSSGNEVDLTGYTIDVQLPYGLSVNSTTFEIEGSAKYLTTNTNWQVDIYNATHHWTLDYELEIIQDTDGDQIPNSEDQDDDNDGFPDTLDSCTLQSGTSILDSIGCPDNDGDGWSNNGDSFPNDASQYSDIDGDGYGDNAAGTRADDCKNDYGDSNRNGTFGCPDDDYDGWANIDDLFPDDSSQWLDFDGDGFGDQLLGTEGDYCPNQFGNSTIDKFGCLDFDGDGFSNDGDDFELNPTQHEDSDGDGYGNNQSAGATQSDAFPSDGSQWVDSDGDGYGDNPFGNQGDQFPNDATRWQDSDLDGYADFEDEFPYDPTQNQDSDGDGFGDNQSGDAPDAFPNDSTEWFDTDMDGVGDNSDEFPYDPSQTEDFDGDGYGDNPLGTAGDLFPDDDTEWFDTDMDGVGDNSDEFPTDPTQNEDSDGDGYGDNANGINGDMFPNDPLRCCDSDGDGYADLDD